MLTETVCKIKETHMYKIVASDLDGTLLSNDHKLPDFTKKIVLQLTQQGIGFIFATGRHYLDVNEMRHSMGIDAYMITSNGARVYDPQGNLIFSENIDESIVANIITLVADHPDILTHVYRDSDWLCNRPDCLAEEFHQESDFNYQLFNPYDCDHAGMAKVYYTAPTHEMLLPLEKMLNARYKDAINVSFSSMNCLEIMAGSVSKGHALQHVLPLLGYQMKDCIAFGDGMNDAEMLSSVGKGCIMQNASDRLKNQLPHLEVIGANTDEAVPHYLQQLYLQPSDLAR